jgi:hypothetical protein
MPTTTRKSVPRAAKKPADRLKAEAKAAGLDESTIHEFKGVTLTVLPYLDWDKKWKRMLTGADIEGWAEAVMDKASATKFLDIPANNGECLDFLQVVNESIGVNPGE